jgi:ribonuclease D
MELSDYEIITQRSELERLAKHLLREEIVAFDTEADSFYHYFDKVCLVQIATLDGCWLVDPIALGGASELEPLGAARVAEGEDPLPRAEYDIYLLKRDCGFSFANLFDTMVSAQLLGYPSIGLAALAERHFGVSLPKDEQRSDWSRRPSPRSSSVMRPDVHYHPPPRP